MITKTVIDAFNAQAQSRPDHTSSEYVDMIFEMLRSLRYFQI